MTPQGRFSWTGEGWPPEVSQVLKFSVWSHWDAVQIDDAFGNWLAGFIDGEGHFGCYGRRPGNPKLAFSLRLRDDDLAVLTEIRARTGLGRIYPRMGSTNGHPVAEWAVWRKSDCAQLIALLRRYPLRAKKARDLETWARAYEAWTLLAHSAGSGRGRHARTIDWSPVWDVIDELRSNRAYDAVETDSEAPPHLQLRLAAGS